MVTFLSSIKSYANCLIISVFLLYPIIATGNTVHPTKSSPKVLKSDIQTGKNVLNLIKARRWKLVTKYINTIRNSELRKALLWFYYLKPNSKATFSQIQNFILENPEWPRIRQLRKRAEEAMRPQIEPNTVINWLHSNPPLTTNGGIHLGEALLKTNNKIRAAEVFRNTWISGSFGIRQERIFYKKYRAHLKREDHLNRMERLLWKGRYYAARRMLNKVNKNYRALAFARMSLRRYRGGVDNAISKVPKKLIKDPGLIFERFRWRRRKGRDQAAIKLLSQLPANYDHGETWWREKTIIVRRAVRAGNISQAYGVASSHSLRGGKQFVEAEWLAGWIALRFLEEGKTALGHFKAVFKVSKFPISRARGAYWVGRTYEFLSNKKQAKTWYKKAGKFYLTYYGQQALFRINDQVKIVFPKSETITENNQLFSQKELVRVTKVLAKSELKDLLTAFIKHLSQIDSSLAWYTNLAKLARESGRLDLAITVAKRAYRDGFALIQEGYPTHFISNKTAVDLSLLYAIIRQESAFNPNAISHAGARGLMQIMPATARRLSKRYKLRYNKSKLNQDVSYNLKLGQAYLAELLTKFNGSHILALAAYNAGPARALKWIKKSGDPRMKDIDEVDWIEMISFKETRNYIQRVIANYNVYRKYMSKITISADKK